MDALGEIGMCGGDFEPPVFQTNAATGQGAQNEILAALGILDADAHVA